MLQEHNILSPIEDIKKEFESVKTGDPTSQDFNVSKPKQELVILPDLGKPEDKLTANKQKKKKCDDSECKRRIPLDQQFCDEHKPPEPLTPEQINSGKVALYNMHLSVYMLAEMASHGYNSERFKLDGLTNLLLEQREQIEEIHANLIEYYGIENIEQLCSPLLALATVTTGHVIRTVKENQKKDGGLGLHPQQNMQ